jgi:hypothetical protein
MGEGQEKFLVFAGMRNEGPFIVEWVSWYRMLGFDVMIGYNDCTDHSPDLLQRLAGEGWITTFEHRPRPGVTPKQSAHRNMRRRPEVAACDWLLICDVDEFLVLHRGNGTISSFMDWLGRDHLGVSFHWKCFGNSGHMTWEDGLVHRQFSRCGAGDRKPNAMIKTMIHDPLRFQRYSDHSPWEFEGTFGDLPDCFVDSEGRAIPDFITGPLPVRYTTPERITHQAAQMNHYIIRADESFDLKRGTLSATAQKDRYTEQFYRNRNRNDHKDTSALDWAERFDRVHAGAMALPGVRRLHHLCCADYVARLCAKKGVPVESDPRWRMHLDFAAAEDTG